jgi:hypothetical protein
MRSELLLTRLRRVVAWRKTKFDRMRDRIKDDNDRRAAYHAADLYTDVYRRLEGCAVRAVTPYRDD